MGGISYRKPPITEAVIAFHFSEPLGARERERFQVKVKRTFPRAEELRSVQVTIGAQVAVEQSISGYKLSSADGLSVIILGPEQFAVSRLAPYASWEQLVATVRANWDSLLTIVGRPSLKALSTRYINRIDIPVKSVGGSLNPDRFFNLGVRRPEGNFDTVPGNFSMQVALQSPDARFQHVITFASAVPALIDHASFLLDIDTATLGPLPTRLDDAWPLVDELHSQKNLCFESCITNETRRLFQ